MITGYYGFMVCVHDLCHYDNKHRWHKPLSPFPWCHGGLLGNCASVTSSGDTASVQGWSLQGSPSSTQLAGGLSGRDDRDRDDSRMLLIGAVNFSEHYLQHVRTFTYIKKITIKLIMILYGCV